MYLMIRWFCAGIIIFLIIYSFGRNRKMSFAKFLIVGIGTLLLLIPFENYFIEFETIDELYKYKYSTNIPEDAIILYGKDSVKLIINDEETFYFAKDENGYKLSSNDSCATILYHKIVNDCSIRVFRFKKTNDYYISIVNLSGDYKKISDSEQTKFNSVVYNMSGKDYYYNHGYVYDLNDDYYIEIDGEKVYFDEK